MQSEYTKELADRLTTAWRQWTTTELSVDVGSFIEDVKNSCNDRMIERDDKSFILSDDEGGTYHFMFLPSTSTWMVGYELT